MSSSVNISHETCLLYMSTTYCWRLLCIKMDLARACLKSWRSSHSCLDMETAILWRSSTLVSTWRMLFSEGLRILVSSRRLLFSEGPHTLVSSWRLLFSEGLRTLVLSWRLLFNEGLRTLVSTWRLIFSDGLRILAWLFFVLEDRFPRQVPRIHFNI